MASYTVVNGKHQTLAASTIDTVTMNASETVKVTNRGQSDIYYTLGLAGGTATDPTVGGDNTYVVTAGGSVVVDPDYGNITSVKLISAGTPNYSVEGF